jgi:RsiW-degrading membrane proteinase PrsW (M82 family)
MDMYKWAVILGAALIPTIIYTIYIRNIEIYEREGWGWIGLGYIWGAAVALPFIFVLGYLFSGQYLREHEYYELNSSLPVIIFICLILPVVGELIKVIGILLVKGQVEEVEDGLIYGATLGLGFAAMVNVFYLYQGFDWDPAILVLLIIPSISTALLHASSSAIAGYGASKKIVEWDNLHMIAYFFAGVLIHALFNGLSLASLVFKDTLGNTYYILGIVIILVVSNLVFRTIRARMLTLIKLLDQETEDAHDNGTINK